jgi:hypothetical protein
VNDNLIPYEYIDKHYTGLCPLKGCPGMLSIKYQHYRNNKRYLECNQPECKGSFYIKASKNAKIKELLGKTCERCGFPLVEITTPVSMHTYAHCANCHHWKPKGEY